MKIPWVGGLKDGNYRNSLIFGNKQDLWTVFWAQGNTRVFNTLMMISVLTVRRTVIIVVMLQIRAPIWSVRRDRSAALTMTEKPSVDASVTVRTRKDQEFRYVDTTEI